MTGTVRTTLRMPSADAVFQKEVPPRIEKIFGFSVGMSPQMNFGGSLGRRTMLRSGKYVSRSRMRKS